MELRRWNSLISLAALCLVLTAAAPARAQYGTLADAGYPTIDLYGRGYGSTPVGGYGAFPFGYAPASGNMGPGYQGAGQLMNQAAQAAAPQAPIAARPVFDVTTATPGWYTPARRARRRVRSQANAPLTRPFDDAGKIDWPGSIPVDPSTASLRRAVDDAVSEVVHESKTTGHASVRQVIEAKNRITAFERKVLPELKTKNAADGTALEAFFLHLDAALDSLTIMK